MNTPIASSSDEGRSMKRKLPSVPAMFLVWSVLLLAALAGMRFYVLPRVGFGRPTELVAVYENVVFSGDREFTACQSGSVDAARPEIAPIYIRIRDIGVFRLDKITPRAVAMAAGTDISSLDEPAERRGFICGGGQFVFVLDQLVFVNFQTDQIQVGSSPDGPFYSSLSKKTLVETFGEPVRYGRSRIHAP